MTDPSERRARVFISCGQRKESDEPALAQRIAECLEELGYDTYIAVQRQSLRSLRENIFEHLRDAEYFLFVDFTREELVPLDGGQHERRGSLFAHQELAIASYLEIDVLAFRENGVKDGDGIMGHLQTNSTLFYDRHALPGQIVDEVKRLWNPQWRNVLEATLDPSSPHRAKVNGTDVHGQFYLLRVDNAHRSTIARDCCAYIRSIVDMTSGLRASYATAELKWSGVMQPNVSIMPGGFRELDAVWIPEPDANRPGFLILTDSSRHVPQLQGPGKWEITYEIVSSNIPGARITLLLELDGTVTGSGLRVIRQPAGTRGRAEATVTTTSL